MAYFEGNNMTGGYGNGPDIINSCSVNVNRGEIVSILGPNGAGKSTAMKAMLGLLNLKSGSITIDGKDITKLSPQDRVKQGISFVPQTKNVFAGMTVEENLLVALSAAGLDQQSIPKSVYDTFPVLYDMRNRRGGDLSGGQQQQLAIGRALTTRPKLLILDEPTEGIQPNIITMIGEVIQRLVEENGMTILLVEQYVEFVKKYADEFLVMNRGRLVAQGSVDQLDTQVINTHLSI